MQRDWTRYWRLTRLLARPKLYLGGTQGGPLNRFRISLTLALLFATTGLVISSRVHAQAAPRSPLEALTTDSTAWQRVITHVVEMLSPQLVRTAVDSARQPWELQLPPEEPHRRLLEAQLRTVLRARLALEVDSIVYSLALGPLRVNGDTARVHVQTSVTRRCPGTTRTAGWGNTFDVLVPRDQRGIWGAARPGLVQHGDRAGCPGPPR